MQTETENQVTDPTNQPPIPVSTLPIPDSREPESSVIHISDSEEDIIDPHAPLTGEEAKKEFCLNTIVEKIRLALSSQLNADPEQLHMIAEVIRNAKKKEVSSTSETPAEPETTCQKIVHYFKYTFAILMLLGRALACLYRYVLMRDTIRLFLTVPGLSDYANAEHTLIITQAVAGAFGFSDIVRTVDSTQVEVISFFTQENWTKGLTNFFKSIKSGEYPWKLMVASLFVSASTAIKAKGGFEETLAEAITLPHMSGLKRVDFLSYVVATCSTACLIAFIVFGRAMWVSRANNELNNNEEWIAFSKNPETKRWLRLKNMMGAVLSTAGSLASGISIFYSNGDFVFNNIKNIIFFILMLPTNTYFNYTWSFNPVYKFNALLELDNVDNCEKCAEEKTQKELARSSSVISVGEQQISAATLPDRFFQLSEKHKETVEKAIKKARQYNNLFCSLGGGFVMCPSIIRALQVILYGISLIAKDDRIEAFSKNPYFVMGGFILSIPFVIGIFLQDCSMMKKDTTHHKTPEQNSPMHKSVSMPEMTS